MKKLKDTKVGGWLKEYTPKILEIVGDVVPGKDVFEVVSKLIANDKTIPGHIQVDGLALIQDFELEMEREMTRRITGHQELEAVQLQQEDLWTKRARPTRQYFWLIFLLICYPVSMWTTGSVIDLPEIVLGGVFVDFGLYTWKRTEEKKIKKV